MTFRRVLSWLFIGLGVFALAVGVLGWQVAHAAANPQVAPLPKEIGGQPLLIADTGKQAALEISRLHQKSFPLVSAAVGIYRGAYNAQIWASGFTFRWMANQVARSMSHSIATETNLPFRPTGERTVQGVKVYTVEGLGQQHFFFARGRLVIWLAADPQIAEQALQDTLAFYSREDQ